MKFRVWFRRFDPVPRDCTNWVQIGHDYVGKVFVFHGIFRGCSKHRLLKHSSKHSSQSIAVQAFLIVEIISVKNNFWEHSPSCGDVQTKCQLEAAEWLLGLPGSHLSLYSTQPYVSSLLVVLAQGHPLGGIAKFLWGRNGHNFLLQANRMV